MTNLIESSAAPVSVTLASSKGLGDVLAGLSSEHQAVAKSHGFKGDAGQQVLLPGSDGGLAGVLYGIGGGDDVFVLSGLIKSLPAGDYVLAGSAGWEEGLIALALELGDYDFDRYKSDKREATGVRFVLAGEAATEATRLASAVKLTRDLVNTPSSDMGPEELAGAVKTLAKEHGAKVSEIIGDDLLKEGHEMIHAVGRASTRTPRLVDMTWGPEEAPKVTLVGKGVCFDSGGLDIKPAVSMLLMKKDMGGAANVLGLAQMIMANKLNVRLRLLVPAVENSISGNAFRPGDVLKSYKGLTVEIENTDAEGRLVLGDALALADEEAPDLMIDMATLTGAARIAMGAEVVPFFTEDEAFASDLFEKGKSQLDPVWQMPLWQPYAQGLSSKVADVMHTSPGGLGGAITAALFLQKFVEKTKTWAHFDIFAWNPADRPGHPFGGEAMAIRAIYQLVKSRYGSL